MNTKDPQALLATLALLVPALVSLFATLAGVGLGWFLNWRTARSTRLMELKIENFGEWMAGMEQSLVDGAAQQDKNPYRTPLCEKRLLIIERDSYARRLIKEVHDSLPAFQSKAYNDLNAIAHSDSEWDWPPFREKMDKLQEHLRRSIS